MDDPEPTSFFISLLLTLILKTSYICYSINKKTKVYKFYTVLENTPLFLYFSKYRAVPVAPLGIVFFACLLFLSSCQESNPTPKPEGLVRLEYPAPKYALFLTPNCPFNFEYSTFSKIVQKEEQKCWYNISYPAMKGTVHLTYSPVENNIFDLIKDAQKLVNEHKIKASSIQVKSFAYPEKNIYGNIYRLGGESASNLQFYITDSTRNFLSGNVYFRVQPRPDSLRPAIDYIERDIINLIETTTWK